MYKSTSIEESKDSHKEKHACRTMQIHTSASAALPMNRYKVQDEKFDFASGSSEGFRVRLGYVSC